MAVADGDSVESGELLVSVDSSSVGQCASSTSIDCNMSFSTGWILDSACSTICVRTGSGLPLMSH